MNPVDQAETTTDIIDASTGKKLNIIDCDIHPRMPKGVQSLMPYLPEKWQARLGMKGALVKDEVNPRNTFAVPSAPSSILTRGVWTGGRQTA